MNLVEEKYWSHINAMTGQERVARSVSMFVAVRQMLENKILQQQPELSELELKRAVAEQFYCTDDAALALIRHAS